VTLQGEVFLSACHTQVTQPRILVGFSDL